MQCRDQCRTPWWNEYVGLPFADKGRTREGCDCWGLVRLVLHEQFGIDLPSYTDDYTSTADNAGIAGAIDSNMAGWRIVPPGEAREGDVALFRIGGLPLHVGVVIGDVRYMLHVCMGIDACTEQYRAPRWLSRLEGVYRHEG